MSRARTSHIACMALACLATVSCMEEAKPASDAGSSADATTDGADAQLGADGGDAAGAGDDIASPDPGGPRYWLRSVGGPWRDELHDVLPEPDGGAWLLGTTESAGAGNWDAWLLRVDACGGVVSAQTLGGAAKDQGVALGRLDGGDLLVVGSSESFERSLEVFVSRVAPGGQPSWSVAVGGPGWDAAVAVTATADDDSVILGETYNFGPGAPETHNLLVFGLDGAGKLRWERTLGGGKDGDAGFDVLRADAKGGVVIVGATESYGLGRDDVWLLRLDAAGEVLWARTYGGEEDDEGRALWHDGAGGFWLTGFTRGFDAKKSDAFVLHVDGDGAPLTHWRYGGDGKDRGYAVLPTADGLLLLGVTDSIDGYDDGYALGLAPDGEVRWMRRVGSDKYDDILRARPAPGGQDDAIWVGRTESYGVGGRDGFAGRLRSDGVGGCKVREVDAPWQRRSAKLPVPGKALPEVATGAELRAINPVVQSVPTAAGFASTLSCLSPACPADAAGN